MPFYSKISSLFVEKLTRAQTLMLGYVFFSLLGTGLLMLPISTSQKQSLPLIDALFTSVSAISGSGLIIVDTATYFSPFGQTIIFLLIQIGCIGYMLFFSLAVLIFGGRLSLANKLLLKESISPASLNLRQFIFKVFKYTLLIELSGAILLTIYWMKDYSLIDAFKYGVFHSMSAFCTAGFSLFSDNLASYRDSYLVNSVIILVAFAGGIGFYVLYDISIFIKCILSGKERPRLSVHTKTVLSVSLVIIVISTVILFFTENYIYNESPDKHFLYTFFQSASSQTTAGYNTIDINKMKDSSLFLLIPVMFIGGSPSGTAGGIKTSVFILMLISLFTFLRDRKNINLFKRNIPSTIINRAFSIGLLAISWLFLITLFISFFEEHSFISLLFEVVSAFSNIGLSTGITPALTSFSKIFLSLTMLMGRVGPLLVGYTIFGTPKPESYQYPEANILIV